MSDETPLGVETSAAGADPTGESRAARLRALLLQPDLGFLMESHNALSAKIAEEVGFHGLWASGLSISAALGVRDSNEASWTQVLEVLEFMSDATRVPILVDGDTGYGNFNNMRRLVRKLEQRGIAGVCIEDKVFPKTNSFLEGPGQQLADIDEFCGRIAAGKETQASEDFVVVARVEALIAGWGMGEALKRAEAYRRAGADAILIHSRKRTAEEVVTFKAAWGDRLPVVIVPTKYYSTPTEIFREHGFAAVIWANHLLRSSISAMQETARRLFAEQSLANVEERVAPLAEVFRLQGADELAAAEQRFLPKHASETNAVILGASRGEELGELTKDRPKCMVEIDGRPILDHIAGTFRSVGVRNLAVIRGYRRDSVNLQGLTYYDCAEPRAGEVYTLAQAVDALHGHSIVCYGDVLVKRHVLQELLDHDADFACFVDTNWQESRNRGRAAEYVICSLPPGRDAFLKPAELVRATGDENCPGLHGEWMGLLKLSDQGSAWLRQYLAELPRDPERLRSMGMVDLLNAIVESGQRVQVIYTTGSWLDIDSLDDLMTGGAFQRPLE